ncbi:hypothetical protein MNBD_BACTEROID01-1687 [hydrothermal vent metagenome]|uniref:Uncharacterized protein n=1 Tax=hydrothermal vent metagenome TaxID=652676 RepID=A0A3B0URW4_9ZZZZ
MKYINLFIFITIYMPSFNTYAQELYRIGNINELAGLSYFAKVEARDRLTGEGIKGSPYENEEFTNGFLVTINNTKYENIPLRLNIYNDGIEYQSKDGEILALYNKEIINHLMIGGSKYKYLPYAKGDRTYKTFFRVIEEGKASLLVRQRVIFREARPAADYKKPAPPTFKRQPDEYYIRLEDGLAQKVSGKKDLEIIFPPSVKAFIKRNKIKATRLDGLQKLVHYYNMN